MSAILKREALEYLNKELLLPYTGIEQDWELEMANSQRVNEFLSFYKNQLSIDIKIALMSLILASYDDLLNIKGVDIDKTWAEIKEILESEKGIFLELLAYWGLYDENAFENYFKITPLIREIK